MTQRTATRKRGSYGQNCDDLHHGAASSVICYTLTPFQTPSEQNEMREAQSQMRREQSEIRREQSEMRSDQDRGRKWEERTWDVIKWVGGISAALSISAAIALVGLVIRLSLSQ